MVIHVWQVVESLPTFEFISNVAWFKMVLMGSNTTQKRRGIVRHLGIFQTLLGYLLSVFHKLSAVYSIGSWIFSLIIFLLNPCTSIVLKFIECGTES